MQYVGTPSSRWSRRIDPRTEIGLSGNDLRNTRAKHRKEAGQAKVFGRRFPPLPCHRPIAAVSETALFTGRGGTRTPRENPEKTTVSEQGGAESGAHAAPMTVSNPDLAAVVTTWPKLPEAVRAGIVAMVRTVSDGPTA
jgi:hypothetical protein